MIVWLCDHCHETPEPISQYMSADHEITVQFDTVDIKLQEAIGSATYRTIKSFKVCAKCAATVVADAADYFMMYATQDNRMLLEVRKSLMHVTGAPEWPQAPSN